MCLAYSPTPVVYYYIELVGTLPGGTRMVQLPQENSIFTRTVRRAAGEDRLSHAVILTGRGDLTAAARFLAAAHVCEGTGQALPALPPLPQGTGGHPPGRDPRAGYRAQGADGGGSPRPA